MAHQNSSCTARDAIDNEWTPLIAEQTIKNSLWFTSIHLCASKVNEDNIGAFEGGKNQSDCRDCYQGPIRL